MKKIFALATVLALFATSAFAQEVSIKNFKLFGEGSLMGYTYENCPDNNFGGTSGYTILGFTADVLKDVSATVALGYSFVWGERNVNGRTVADNTTNRGYLDIITIVEANLTFSKLFDIEGLKLKVGRQYYGDEGSPILYFGIRRYQPLLPSLAAAVSFDPTITSLDAVTAYYEKDNIKANLVYGILANNDISGNSVLIGGDFKYLNFAEYFDAQAYLYNVENLAVAPVPNYTVFGVKPTFKIDDFKASVEFAKNFGGNEIFSNEAANTNLIKFDASYNIKSAKVTPRATYLLAGGLDSFFFTKTFFAFSNYQPGLIESPGVIMMYNDIQMINLGVDYAKIEKLVLSFDFFNFGPRDGNWDAYNEMDLTAKYAYSKNVELFGGIGHRFGNNSTGNRDSSTVQAGLTYKF